MVVVVVLVWRRRGRVSVGGDASADVGPLVLHNTETRREGPRRLGAEAGEAAPG